MPLMVFNLNPFKPVTLFQQQKIEYPENTASAKVLNRIKCGRAVTEPPNIMLLQIATIEAVLLILTILSKME
jgi:hypothetical protein